MLISIAPSNIPLTTSRKAGYIIEWDSELILTIIILALVNEAATQNKHTERRLWRWGLVGNCSSYNVERVCICCRLTAIYKVYVVLIYRVVVEEDIDRKSHLLQFKSTIQVNDSSCQCQWLKYVISYLRLYIVLWVSQWLMVSWRPVMRLV